MFDGWLHPGDLRLGQKVWASGLIKDHHAAKFTGWLVCAGDVLNPLDYAKIKGLLWMNPDDDDPVTAAYDDERKLRTITVENGTAQEVRWHYHRKED